MNIKEMRAKLAEIDNELNGIVETLSAEPTGEPEERDAQFAELESRSNELTEERKNLLDMIATEEKRIEEEKRMAEEAMKPEPIETLEERNIMDVMEIRKSKEYIDAFANYIKTEDDTECRALLTENASGTIPVPVFVEEIVKTAWEREGIMSRVRKAYLKGNLKVGFEISATDAAIHTEGAAAPNEETLVLGTVSIVPQSIKKWIKISDEVYDMRGEAFLRYIYDELTYKIAKKAADTLVAAIVAAPVTATTTAVAVPVVTVKTAGMDTVAQALALLSDEATNPTIVMNKQTWAAFKGIQYANGYGADPFEGLDVVFNNSLTAYSAATTGVPYVIVGDFEQGAIANFPNGEGIDFKFDDVSLAEADLIKIVGREYVGLGVVASDAFAKVVK